MLKARAPALPVSGVGDAPEDECELEFRGFPLLFYWLPQRPVLLPFSPLTNCHPWLHMDVWLAGVSSVEGRGEQPRCSSRPVCVFKLSDSEWGKGVTLPSSDHHHASRDALNVWRPSGHPSVGFSSFPGT